MKEISIRMPSRILELTAAATLMTLVQADTKPIEYEPYPGPELDIRIPEESGIPFHSYVPIDSLVQKNALIQGPQEPPPDYFAQRAQEQIRIGLEEAIEEERVRIELEQIRIAEEEEKARIAEESDSSAASTGNVVPLPVYAEGETVWDRLVGCEASGNWAANTGNGFEGGLQFLPSTWQSFKDPDMPFHAYDASREQQIIVAERVLVAQGWGAWPGCTAKLGIR